MKWLCLLMLWSAYDISASVRERSAEEEFETVDTEHQRILKGWGIIGVDYGDDTPHDGVTALNFNAALLKQKIRSL